MQYFGCQYCNIVQKAETLQNKVEPRVHMDEDKIENFVIITIF